jgi:hypothetical protein
MDAAVRSRSCFATYRADPARRLLSTLTLVWYPPVGGVVKDIEAIIKTVSVRIRTGERAFDAI